MSYHFKIQQDFLFSFLCVFPNLIVFLSGLFPICLYISAANSSKRLCMFSEVRAEVSTKVIPFSSAYFELSTRVTKKIMKDVKKIRIIGFESNN